mgnify:CR=1 FL=1
MRMRTAREIRRIDRDDRAFTLKDNWVWVHPIRLQTSTVRDVDSIAVEGVPDIIPLDGFRERPIGSDPDEIKKCPSPSTVGITENDLYIDRT